MIKQTFLIEYGKEFDSRQLGRGVELRKDIAAKQENLSSKLVVSAKIISKCPVCRDLDSSLFVVIYDYRYRECKKCGHIFCSTLPDVDSLIGLYEGEGNNVSVQGLVYNKTVFDIRKSLIAAPKVEFVKRVLLHNNTKLLNNYWIDIGCGTGELLSAASDCFFEVLGIESDPNLANFVSNQGLNVVNQNFDYECSERYLNKAGIVSLINILEHITDPITFLNKVVQGMSDGVILIEVPRHPSFASLSAKAFPHLAYRHIYPPDHLHIFTDDSFNHMLDQCGLHLIGVWYYGQGVAEIVQASSTNISNSDNLLYDACISAACKMEAVADRAGLSDTLLAVVQVNSTK
jgi:SAM-dependent methyltransferase